MLYVVRAFAGAFLSLLIFVRLGLGQAAVTNRPPNAAALRDRCFLLIVHSTALGSDVQVGGMALLHPVFQGPKPWQLYCSLLYGFQSCPWN